MVGSWLFDWEHGDLSTNKYEIRHDASYVVNIQVTYCFFSPRSMAYPQPRFFASTPQADLG